MTSTGERERALEGALKILRRGLGLRRGQTLTLFSDETGREAAEVFIEAARSHGLVVHDRFVPESDQARFRVADGFELSAEDREAITAARGILTCLSDTTEGTPFRTELIRVGTDRRRRLGHIPGARLGVLIASAASDDGRIARRCDDLCLALSLARRARVRTWRADGTSADLELDLGGLERPSIQSTGEIPLNTWGNIPGGESFIAPVEDTAEGEYVLNGSLRGLVLDGGRELVLGFHRGRLEEIAGDAGAEARFKEFLAYAWRRGDDNCDRLAELGVGVNDGIAALTGSSLIDEKCAGTAHIAVGGNTRYGGSISSCIHEDLVTRTPSLWLDGRQILDRGRWAFDAAEWRETLATVEPLGLPGACIVRRTPLIKLAKGRGKLLARRRVAAGRSSSYTVAEGDDADVLWRLYRLIPDINSDIQCRRLAGLASEKERIGREVLLRALTIFDRHGVIEVDTAAAGGESGG